MQATLGLALLGLGCIVLYIDAWWLGMSDEPLDGLASIILTVLGTVSGLGGMYSARNLPVANRAPTSAELAAGIGKGAPTVPAREP